MLLWQPCVPKQQRLIKVSLREKQTQKLEEDAGPRSEKAQKEELQKRAGPEGRI